MEYSLLLLLMFCCFMATAGEEIDEAPPVNVFDLISKHNHKIEAIKKKGRFGGPEADEANIVQGDMLLNHDEPRFGAMHDTAGSQLPPLFNWHNKLWVTRNIPYDIDRSLTNDYQVIESSLRRIQKDINNCITFRRKRGGDKHWLYFYSGSGCFSGIGRRYWSPNSPTKISLGRGCLVEAVIMHEVLHAIGFPHEQSRRDRDSFVRIYSNRIIPSMKSNFDMNEVMGTNTMHTPYDLKSIMHYSPYSFASNPKAGHTIESKFDPNYPLGGYRLSSMDIKELRLLYQCDKRSGYSDWYDAPCMCNTRNQCRKSKVRFCIGGSGCPGVNEYGTNWKSESCSKADADADLKKKDGHWGSWGKFTLCKSSSGCGWGFKSRTRSCNNPKPVGDGKKCPGISKETNICRLHRCAGKNIDEHFNGQSSKWKLKGFKIVKRTDMRTSGPSADHTSEVSGNRNSYFAAARGKSYSNYIEKASLESPEINAPTGAKCLIFHYMLNGEYIAKNALSVYMKATDGSGNIINFSFSKSGHQGNYWKRAVIGIMSTHRRFKLMIEGRFMKYRESVIAIDDIFFDHNQCPPGLDGCRDFRGKNCLQRARNGQCSNRFMFGECCASCQKHAKTPSGSACKDNNSQCKEWAQKGECKKNAGWMKTNCCLSCSSTGKKKCSDSRPECKGWAKKGECKKNPDWMSVNCCASCSRRG